MCVVLDKDIIIFSQYKNPVFWSTSTIEVPQLGGSSDFQVRGKNSLKTRQPALKTPRDNRMKSRLFQWLTP